VKIEGRAADNFEHIGGRRLLLQRLFKLVEQPRVLDGNDSLSGEVLDQPDLLVGEGTDFLAGQEEGADQFVPVKAVRPRQVERPGVAPRPASEVAACSSTGAAADVTHRSAYRNSYRVSHGREGQSC
jgi:Ni,Fe-hydrogenase III small subunit